MTSDDIMNQAGFTDTGIDPSETSIIKVVGVGGGGGNAVGYMFNQGVAHVRFVVANTDKQALKNSPVPEKVLLGTTGLGAGNDPAVAEAAANESLDQIGRIFDDNTKMVFITAGLGGGTGTGASPVVAKAAKDRGILTIGIVTIPFLFEGKKKITKALSGAKELSQYVDAMMLINNEKLIEIYGDLDFDSAWDKADETLATAARSISELITADDARINLDFNDVDTTLRNGRTAIISCGYGEGDNRVEAAIQDALRSPLLNNRNIQGAKKLLFNLYYDKTSTRKFLANEMTAFTSFVTSLNDVDVIYGVGYDSSLGEKVKLTILAAGFDSDLDEPTPMVQPKNPRNVKSPIETSTEQQSRVVPDAVDRQYEGKLGEMERQNKLSRYVILTPEQMDDDAVVERLEKSPANGRTPDQIRQIVGTSTASTGAATGAAAGEASSGTIDFSLY